MLYDHLKIGVIGARGAVGTEVLSILAERSVPHTSIVCFGSDRSVGAHITYRDQLLTLRATDSISDHNLDYALLCADSNTAHCVSRLLADTQTTVIDNSSAFRMDPSVPLVIPEVNAHELDPDVKLIANPNCSTIMMLRALDPIHQSHEIQNVIVTTYQAVSGAGRAGINELHDQSRACLNGSHIAPDVFPVSCAFNVFEHESPLQPETGFNGEESKMIDESRKIWNAPRLPILPTCIRVPVERAHAQSIIVDIRYPIDEDGVRARLHAQGIRTLSPGEALTPRDTAGSDDVVVGRIRVDPSSSGRRILLWICCDQIRKGAALNAIQIMDHLESIRSFGRAQKKSTRLGKACAEEQNRKVLA